MKRYLLKIYGIVQGVGFRPYVYNLAIKKDIKGYVKNCGAFVQLDIEGKKENVSDFLRTLIMFPPALAKIERVKAKALQEINYTEFQIVKSSLSEEKMNFISPDVALCNKCQHDIKDKNSRFFNYPFTNCTECGPRYSIIKSLPYDRKCTTMEKFKFCDDCNIDYNEPTNRRFHAEAIACNNCGPVLSLYDKLGNLIDEKDYLKTCSDLIKSGNIIAIKGIGGFHLCCDAKSDTAVKRLREKKMRPDKSFAVMVKDIETVKKYAFVNEVEEKILCGRERPIVLLKRKESDISKYVAPNNKYLGLFLPYTPLLALLFEYLDICVMTSANISEEPIIYENQEAQTKLKEIADYFLLNDREIHMPQDDSVVQVVNDEVMVIRSGRGYAPITLKINNNKDLLAVGAEQKSSYAISQNGYVYLSQYMGDLKDVNTYSFYQDCLSKSLDFFKLNPSFVICDYHPGYLSTILAVNLNKSITKVYHHHAHMVSAMVDAKINEDVIGVIFDGTGYGIDQNIWGGEFLIGNLKEFNRIGHMKYVKIQGNDDSNKKIYKIALSYLFSINSDYKLNCVDDFELNIIKKAWDSNINCYFTSSIGRFFDCASALIGLRKEVSYEGQAPLELESIITDDVSDFYNFDLIIRGNYFEISYVDVIKGIIEDLKINKSNSYIATKFHNTIVEMVIKGVLFIRDNYHLNKVVLSGGVFQNRYLLTQSYKNLKNLNFEVYYNKIIPINDNGISCGQIYCANSKLEE